jgi:hypothetical protein
MSAIATIRLNATGPQEAQHAVEKLVAILRLFEVASVKYLSYRLWGDSITRFVGGRITANEREAVQEPRFLRAGDEERLARFWRFLAPIIPESFYRFAANRWNYNDVAYERYSVALMSPVSFEERVASAAMALEAILLEESQELTYKLRMRAAKLLSFLREEPIGIRTTVRDAYNVRSTFAHGGRLSFREKSKLENRYQGVGGLARAILNIVRKAILVSLLVARPKRDLIGLIDDALIERTREDELRQLLLPVAELM